jgi:hypothetical protein
MPHLLRDAPLLAALVTAVSTPEVSSKSLRLLLVGSAQAPGRHRHNRCDAR